MIWWIFRITKIPAKKKFIMKNKDYIVNKLVDVLSNSNCDSYIVKNYCDTVDKNIACEVVIED